MSENKFDVGEIKKPRIFWKSDCCIADVLPGKTPGSMYDPPQPVDVCSACGRKCNALAYSEEELEDA